MSVTNSNEVKRGDIYYADLGTGTGSEQNGIRPVVIVQNNVGNKFSPTVIAAAITSKQGKTKLPTHIPLFDFHKVGLSKQSTILLEQIRTIDKSRLKEKLGSLKEEEINQVNKALVVSFDLVQ